MHPVEILLTELTYKDGWSFAVDVSSFTGGKTLLIEVNTFDPRTRKPIMVLHPRPVPDTDYPAGFWVRWLFEQIKDVETHECAEWFQLGEDYPFFPHGLKP